MPINRLLKASKLNRAAVKWRSHNMSQQIAGQVCTRIDWSAFTLIGDMMPPRDPDEEDEEDEKKKTTPPVVREADED
jgi:hypothetical protein